MRVRHVGGSGHKKWLHGGRESDTCSTIVCGEIVKRNKRTHLNIGKVRGGNFDQTLNHDMVNWSQISVIEHVAVV